MNKESKYKFVFESAKEFLDEIISKNPPLNKFTLKQHLDPKSNFIELSDVNRQLIASLQNRNRMPNTIKFYKREKEFKKILFGYDPTAIFNNYKNADDLLDNFIQEFNLQKSHGNRSLWRIFSVGIIDGSTFLKPFENKDAFDKFVDEYVHDEGKKDDLPKLLAKKIKGFGFALACDFLKESGYRDYSKPDVHLIKIFNSLGLSSSDEPYEVYKSIIEMSEAVGEDAYTVDKILWLISSGNFYLVDIDIGSNRDKFIKIVKAGL